MTESLSCSAGAWLRAGRVRVRQQPVGRHLATPLVRARAPLARSPRNVTHRGQRRAALARGEAHRAEVADGLPAPRIRVKSFALPNGSVGASDNISASCQLWRDRTVIWCRVFENLTATGRYIHQCLQHPLAIPIECLVDKLGWWLHSRQTWLSSCHLRGTAAAAAAAASPPPPPPPAELPESSSLESTDRSTTARSAAASSAVGSRPRSGAGSPAGAGVSGRGGPGHGRRGPALSEHHTRAAPQHPSPVVVCLAGGCDHGRSPIQNLF